MSEHSGEHWADLGPLNITFPRSKDLETNIDNTMLDYVAVLDFSVSLIEGALMPVVIRLPSPHLQQHRGVKITVMDKIKESSIW